MVFNTYSVVYLCKHKTLVALELNLCPLENMQGLINFFIRRKATVLFRLAKLFELNFCIRKMFL